MSSYSKVAVRPQHCSRCGVIQQQLITTYIEERLHQHISTHNVATVAKALPWFNGITIKSFVTGRHESRSTSTCPSLHLQHTPGQREVQPDSRHRTGHDHGAGTVHPDSRQQPGSSGSAAIPTSTPPLFIYERGRHNTYSSSGTTSRGQGTRPPSA